MSRRVLALFLMLALFLSMAPVAAAVGPAAPAAPPSQGSAQPAAPAGIFRGVSTAVKFDVSPPLRDIVPLVAQGSQPAEVPERATGLEGALGPQDADGALQTSYGPSLIPAPIVSFNGPGNISSVSPPDPVGDVGPNHYVAMSNLSFQIFDKLGTSLYGPALNNTLWSGFGGDCQTDNSGDPIVLHDQVADRWMLSQFTSSGPTYFNCVAVSTTADPTGSYYRWAFSTGINFPDYPKYGWWPDALYISTREFANGTTFTGMGAYAVKRSDLISGVPAAQVISFLVTPVSAGGAYNIGDGLLPTDLDGSTMPPANSPNYFMGSMDNGGPYGAPADALTLWKFTADFVTPVNSTFVLANTIPIASYDTIFPCTPTSRNCIPQPGTANKIDILSYRQRPLHRLAYRNFGTHESLVTNQSVEAAASMAGIRWWEVRSPNSSPVLYQDSTYAPGTQDTIHRWMGSVAMDSAGNMALGYSASNGTTTYPSSWYTGRLAGDPLNTMPQGEGSIITGTGSQTGSARWGDYTSMNIDPSDDCTFWYVNQWVPTTSSVGWQLRIGSFKFNECGGDPNIDASPLSMSATQATNTSTQQTLTVANTGSGTLNWQIAEEPADLPQMAHPFGYAPRDPAVDAGAGAVGAAPGSPAGVATWQRPEVVLYDNGPLVNSPGTGPGGADESLARDVTVGLTSRGFNHSVAGDLRVADDFTITDPGGWNISSITFFPYMGNAPISPSPISGVNYQIWDGPPDQPTSTVVFGDTTTNRMTSTAFANIYRRLESQPTDATRPVFGTVATAGTILPPGAYWIDWQVDGDINYTGPWAPPVTIDGQTTTGNALQSVSGAWQAVVDTGLQTPLGLPFLIEGTVVLDVACDNPASVGWLSVSPATGANAGGTNTPVTVTFDSTGLPVGTYNANLCVESDDPDSGPGNGTDLVIVPLTLTVQLPTAVALSGLASDAAQSPAPLATLPAAAGLISLALAAGYVWRRKM